jgi:hypothetical protein
VLPIPPVQPTYSVGQGILDKMAQNGDSPAGDEMGIGNFWTECMGMSGRLYRYVKATGKTVSFGPE